MASSLLPSDSMSECNLFNEGLNRQFLALPRDLPDLNAEAGSNLFESQDELSYLANWPIMDEFPVTQQGFNDNGDIVVDVTSDWYGFTPQVVQDHTYLNSRGANTSLQGQGVDEKAPQSSPESNVAEQQASSAKPENAKAQDSRSKRRRGRPRLKDDPHTPQGRRRLQLRLAQDTHRARKDKVICSLYAHIDRISAQVKEISAHLMSFHDHAVMDRLLEREPGFGKDFAEILGRMVLLARLVEREKVDGGDEEDGKASTSTSTPSASTATTTMPLDSSFLFAPEEEPRRKASVLLIPSLYPPRTTTIPSSLSTYSHHPTTSTSHNSLSTLLRHTALSRAWELLRNPHTHPEAYTECFKYVSHFRSKPYIQARVWGYLDGSLPDLPPARPDPPMTYLPHHQQQHHQYVTAAELELYLRSKLGIVTVANQSQSVVCIDVAMLRQELRQSGCQKSLPGQEQEQHQRKVVLVDMSDFASAVITCGFCVDHGPAFDLGRVRRCVEQVVTARGGFSE